MKLSDIKSTVAINMAEGMVKADMNRLHQTGINNAIRFYVGDVIMIPEWDDLEVYTTSFVSKTDNKEHEYDLVKVALNDRVRLIPVASFRRDRQGISEYLEAYSRESQICRDLQICTDDFERMKILAGKTLRVKKMFDARNFRFENGDRVSYNKDDVKTFNTSQWPVFEAI